MAAETDERTPIVRDDRRPVNHFPSHHPNSAAYIVSRADEIVKFCKVGPTASGPTNQPTNRLSGAPNCVLNLGTTKMMSADSQNPYTVSSMDAPAALAVESERVGFIRRTYAHLTGAVLALIAIEAVLFNVVSEHVRLRVDA
jgi:hypothetical protein